MSCDPIYQGTTVQVRGEFRNTAGGLTDTTAELTVELPDESLETPAVDHESLGTYTGELVVDQFGTYRYRWEGSGALIAASEGSFYVRESALP